MTGIARQIIATDEAPAAIGTYSQAVRVGDTVYLSGQIPLVPATSSLVEGGIDAEIRQVFANLAAVSRAAGASLQQVVKLTVYLTDLEHFPRVNALMPEFLKEPYPARAVVGVARLPRDARIEIDAVLVSPVS